MTVNTTQKNTFNWLNNPLIHQSHTFSDLVYTSSFIKEDPIVLACTIKRIREILSNDPTNHELNTCRKPVHLLSISEDENIISPYITTDDRELARRIREHYTQKLMWIILRSDKISVYRENLNKFLAVSDNLYKDNQCGIAYKLPYFYEYDMSLIRVFGSEIKPLVNNDTNQKTLTYITRLNATQRKKQTYEYWFYDEDDNRVMIEIDNYNPLLSLWETRIQSTPIVVNAKFTPRFKDQLNYYSVPPWKWEFK